MVIPKYILRKIEKHNQLVSRAAILEREIDDWYASKVDKYSDVDIAPDYVFSDYKCDIQVTFISTENMQYNLNLLQSYSLAI